MVDIIYLKISTPRCSAAGSALGSGVCSHRPYYRMSKCLKDLENTGVSPISPQYKIGQKVALTT